MAAYRVQWFETGEAFEAAPDESVLDAALRAGVALPNECRFGGCGTCRVKLLDGAVAYEGDELPLGLQPEEAAAGNALACQARACSHLVVSAEPPPRFAEPTRLRATVEAVHALAPDVAHLRLRLPDDTPLVYRPGQYMNVHLPDGTHRSFSMASRPDGTRVDFHVRRIPGGAFTEARVAALRPGEVLEVEIPLGGFRYHAEDERPILMLATGTGLAPLKSMLEALMDDDGCPPVSLYWGGRSEADLYMHAQIAEWAGRLYEFRYVPVLSRAGAGWAGRRGHVQQAVLDDLGVLGDLAEYAVYLCGSPSMIRDAKQALLARGASPDHLYADGFTFQSTAALTEA